MYSKICRYLILIFLVFLNVAIAWSLGVSVRFVGRPMENLELGRTYSLPLVVTNTSKTTRNVVMKVQKPNNLVDGYETIPDVGWIKLTPPRFKLKSGESMSCELKLSIPKDEKYNKRHYEAFVISTVLLDESTGGLSLNVETLSRVKFSVGKTSVEELNKIKKNFKLQPLILQIKNIPLNKKIDIKKFSGKSLKIINQGKDTVTFKFTCIKWKKEFLLPNGCEISPNHRYLRIKSKKIKLKPGETKEINLFIKFPKNPDYRDKKYTFLVKAETSGLNTPIELYTIVVIETRK